MEGLTILTNLSIILLIGLLSTVASKKFRVSNVLLLVLMGVFLQVLEVNGSKVFDFSPTFLVSVATLAIVMIVFDSTSRFQWKELDDLSITSLKLTGWFLVGDLVLVSAVAMFTIFGTMSFNNFLYGMIFASVMVATDPSSLFAMMGAVKHKVINLLEVESIINTPLTVLLPFVFLDLIQTVGQLDILSSFLTQIVPFLQQIVVGVGAGMVIGIIVMRVMKKVYSEQLSPVGMITSALLAYILAANMGGSGILAVATLGLFFGSVYVKKKSTLQEFSNMLSTSLEIIVFVLIGLMVSLPWNAWFYVKAFLIFAVLLGVRALTVFYSLKDEKFKTRELLFATLNIPKGIAMAVVIFSFTVLELPKVHQMLDYMFVIMIYSLLLSTVVTRLSKKFIRVDIHKEKEEADTS